MTNYRQALQTFYESFGVNAYPEDNVPDEAIFPWITYTQERADFGETTETVSHLHYYTDSSALPNAKAEEICKSLRNGVVISCDEGRLVLTTSLPEWQATPDETDRLHKHRIINVSTLWLLTT